MKKAFTILYSLLLASSARGTYSATPYSDIQARNPGSSTSFSEIQAQNPVSATPFTEIQAQTPISATHFTETPARRYETVFFISLPFTSLYSGIIMLGVSAAIQKGNVRFTVPYQATTAGLALMTAGWIAWHDKQTGGPDLSAVEPRPQPARTDLTPK